MREYKVQFYEKENGEVPAEEFCIFSIITGSLY